MNRVLLAPAALACALASTNASARPIGGSFSGGNVGRGPADGLLLGLEGGWATMLADGPQPSQSAWTIGARAGYAFAWGLELHLRYDDLGVVPWPSRSPLQLGTAGLRYTAPLPVMPFAEVDVGPAFALGNVYFGSGASLGVSFPLVNHVLLDLAGHDWLVPIAGDLRQTLSVGLALAITFGGPR